jgi:hypothetical protein
MGKKRRHPFALGPAGQMKLPAAVATIKPEREAGALNGQKRVLLGRKTRLPDANV